ncbi:MAG: hypothetical protein HY555_01445 [Euryarchaeota archaeon]|nr:hypothetical protein [Euryarchaeota archaeon]
MPPTSKGVAPYLFLLIILIVTGVLILFFRAPGEIKLYSAVFGPSGGSLACDGGRALITMPGGVLTANTAITCETVSVSDLPKSLQKLVPVGVLYRLGPEEMAFQGLVEVRLALDSSLYSVGPDRIVITPPLLYTVGRDGQPELLQGLSMVASPSEAYIQGSLTRLGPVVKRLGTVRFELMPGEVSLPPGLLFNTTFKIRNLPREELEQGQQPSDIKLAKLRVSASEDVAAEDHEEWFNLSSGETRIETFTIFCREEGKGSYAGDLHYRISPVDNPDLEIIAYLSISGEVRCVGK